ncbi:MAG: sugar phosphate isomerase/epimerase [Cytophagales bacterium]|nr:sugar phosphate isomerase/epimerase [Cytophagales bacterium]
MTKIGFNVLAWSAGLPDKLRPVTEKLKEIGYDGVEFALDYQSPEVYHRFGEHLRGIGLEATCVMVLSPEENPVSESAAVRAKALDRLRQAIDQSHALGSNIICGPFHSAFATFTRRAPEAVEYQRSAEVLRAAGEHAAGAGITLTPEALNRFECYLCNTMEQLVGLVKAVDHPNVRAMFDTHHANVEEKKLRTAIQTVAPVLAHVHISENDRGTPGDGHVPWDETFATLAAINYQGWLTIEAFTRSDPDFANAINVWREFSEPWDMARNGFTFIKQMKAKYGL